jgi:prolyl oligopeptidase
MPAIARGAALALAALAAAAAAPETQPAARTGNDTDTYFGQTIADPYRWMETPSPELESWVRAQDAFTRATLAKIPGRTALLAHMNAIAAHTAIVTALVPVAGHLFFLRRDAGKQLAALVMRDPAGAEHVLLDPNTLTENGHHVSIDQYQPSPNARRAVVAIAPAGSEEDVLHVLDTHTGAMLPDAIDRTKFASPSWSPDGRSFFYTRLHAPGPNDRPADRLFNAKIFLHVLGTNPAADTPIFGAGIGATTSLDPEYIPTLTVLPGTDYLLATANSGVAPEQDYYLAKIPPPGTIPAWRKIVAEADGVQDIEADRTTLFLLSHHNAPNYQVLSMPLAAPDLPAAKLLVPQGEGVITNIAAASDALYVAGHHGPASFLRRVTPDGTSTDIPLPIPGIIGGNDTAYGPIAADPFAPGADFGVMGWVSPPAWFTANGPDPHTTALSLAPTQDAAPGYTITETSFVARDGVSVPLSIIEKPGTPHDGKQPTLIEGYGAYGIPYQPFPRFIPVVRAWVDAGGVMAIAHVRGGGEFGESWHLAGKKQTKQNTIHDFIDAAGAMMNLHYANNTTLAGTGTSAGGITIGGAITQATDLFRAALIRSGDEDCLRSETTETGPANISEFGTVHDKAGFDALLAMDAYQHVKPGTQYPAVLLVAGANDHRVPLWQEAKMTARLQASGSKRPILLRVDVEAGHGTIGTGAAQANAEWADDLSFLLWQLGVPAYQPRR